MTLQVFLEPEGRTTPELYVQGFSTGLPERLQLALLHTLPGTYAPCSSSAPAPAPGPARLYCWEESCDLLHILFCCCC